jgi:BirA family transcriptional regulator, biotin operon repressor / biotin---[acetyl-CoA-carboxylase] ligase
MGRVWESPPGNFYGSTLVKLRSDDPSIGGLSLAAGVGLFVAVGDPATLKWPNDLLINGAKVAGILMERAGDMVAIGFGINLVSAPDIAGRKTTSLLADGMTSFTRAEMLERLCQSVPWAVDTWRRNGTQAMVRRWETEAHRRGTALTIKLPDGAQFNGQFDGVSDDGALRLRLADGSVRVIYAGDVFLI